MTTVSQAIALQLEARAIPRIYHVPGESFLGLLDALRDGTTRLVTARHEGGAGFMALAEARVTGTTGVAMVTRGPGAANVFIAVHTAHQDATPLVVFVGLIPTPEREREAFQEFDPHAWFGSTAKAVMILDDPDSAAERVARAFDLAAAGRPGPVIIGLPEELLRKDAGESRVYPAVRRTVSLPNPGDMQLVAESFAAAARPVCVVGGDQWDAAAARRLREIAEHYAIPVVSDFRAHDAFPHSSPAWVGSLGFGRNDGARAAFDEADLVCYLGTARKDVLSDGFELGDNAAEVIVVNPDPELREHSGQLDRHFALRPGDWLCHLELLPGQDADRHAQRQARLAALRETYCNWSTPVSNEPDELNREAIFAVLQELLPADTITTVGAGNYAIGALRYLHHEQPRTFLGPRNGAMGFGVPGSVAAALAHPGRTVVAFAGDGCFGMNGQELATLQMYGCRVIVFVLDNSGYGTIQSHQERHYPARPAGTYLSNPNYALIAEAHGMLAHRVDERSGFRDVVAGALSAAQSSLIHIVLPQLNAGTGLHDGTGLDARA